MTNPWLCTSLPKWKHQGQLVTSGPDPIWGKGWKEIPVPFGLGINWSQGHLHPQLFTLPPHRCAHFGDGDSTSSLGSLLQCSTTLSARKFFLISNLHLFWITQRQFPLVLSISYLHACLKLKALHHVITGRAFIPWCHLLSNHRTPQGIPFTWWNISFFSKRGIKDGLFHIIPFCSSILKFCWTHSYSWLISLFFN